MEIEEEKQRTLGGTRTHTIKGRGQRGPETGRGKAGLPTSTSHPDDMWDPRPSY